jgi:type I restriction enzyme S subunit
MTSFTTVKHLSNKQVTRIWLPLPPLAEQRRIVARLDQLMALIDDFEAKQTNKRALSTRFTKASLEALTTAESPEDFDTAWQRVLQNWDCVCGDSRLVAEVRALCLWLALSGRLEPSEVDDGPWHDTTIGELAEVVTSGSRGWKEFYAAEGALFIRSQDIKTDALDLSAPAFVNLPVGVEGSRTRVQKDDLLVTITGANVGKAARVKQALPEAYVSQHVALIRLRDPRHSPWVHTWLVSSQNGRATLTAMSYGDKPGLNLDNVRNVPVRIPSLVAQQRIIARAEHLMRFCDNLEAKLRHAEDRASKLVVAVVQEMVA